MTHPLDGVQAKLDRSREHLNSLVEEIRVFLDSHPYVLSTIPMGNEWSAGYFHSRDEPPIHLGIIAGDFAQNLRAALDHLVYQIARLTDESPQGTAFPIASTEADYLVPRRDGEPSLRDRCLAGISEEHRAMIDEVQPYKGPSGAEIAGIHPLVHLRRFTNTDKHKVIHTAFGRLDSVEAITEGGSAAVELRVADPLPILTENAQVYQVRITDWAAATDSEVQVKVRLLFSLAFGKYSLDEADFGTLRGYVIGIVDRFRPLFF